MVETFVAYHYFHQMFTYGQTQTGSLALGLGGEERVEDGWEDMLGDALPVIDHLDGHVVGLFVRHRDDLDFAAFG